MSWEGISTVSSSLSTFYVSYEVVCFYKNLIQKPFRDCLALSNIPQSEGTICTAGDNMVIDSDHAADVLLVTNTDGLDVKGLREMRDEYLLIAIARRQKIPHVDLLLSSFSFINESSNHSGAMANKERFLFQFWKVKRHNIPNLITNNQVFHLLEEPRVHRRALLFQFSIREVIHARITQKRFFPWLKEGIPQVASERLLVLYTLHSLICIPSKFQTRIQLCQ